MAVERRVRSRGPGGLRGTAEGCELSPRQLQSCGRGEEQQRKASHDLGCSLNRSRQWHGYVCGAGTPPRGASCAHLAQSPQPGTAGPRRFLCLSCGAVLWQQEKGCRSDFLRTVVSPTDDYSQLLS